MTNPDRHIAGAVARGWIVGELPASLHTRLLAHVDEWLAGSNPVESLWLGFATGLRRFRLLDAEESACYVALDLMPDHPHFRFRLAEIAHLTGRPDESEIMLGGLFRDGWQNGQTHLLALELAASRPNDFASRLPAALAWFESQEAWSQDHSDLARILIDRGEIKAAGHLLKSHPARTGDNLTHLYELAQLAMRSGAIADARALFEPIWKHPPSNADFVCGRFSGAMAPFTDADEKELADQIEAAFAAPPPIPQVEMPKAGPPDQPVRVVVVGYERTGLPNDIAYHLVSSARDAGLDASVYLDNALVLAHDFRLTDAEIEARVQAFEAEMERQSPDVVVLDWTGPLTMRGLNPERMERLKRRVGFRFICMIRDAHHDALRLINCWLPATDVLMHGHPLSSSVTEATADYRSRILIIPIPCLHTLNPPESQRDTNLSFIGAVNFSLRLVLLSALLTEDVPFTAIYGDERKVLAHDMESYQGLLCRSRAILNISAHTGDEHLLTGRVWETAAAGSLLVEQENPAILRFFTPYRHFLPWKTIDDIGRIAHFVKRRPDLAQRIAAEYQTFAVKHFGSRPLWEAILSRATSCLSVEERDKPASAAWLDTALLTHWDLFKEVRIGLGSLPS